MIHARCIGAGELQRVELVVVPGANVGRGLVLSRKRQAVDVNEEAEALVVVVGEHLDIAQMRDVVAGPAHSSSTVRGKTDWKPSAYFA